MQIEALKRKALTAQHEAPVITLLHRAACVIGCRVVPMTLRLAIACHLAYAALAVNYLFDETVWTKQTWPDFTLNFPSQRVLQSASRNTAFTHVSELGPWDEGSYAQSHSTYDTGCVYAVGSTSVGICLAFHNCTCRVSALSARSV